MSEKHNRNFIAELTESATKRVPELQSWPNQFRLRASEFNLFLQNYNFPENSDILEVGCGNAFTSIILSRIARRVVATDLMYQNDFSHSVGMDKAAALLKNFNVRNCFLVACDGQNLPFADFEFDVVFNEYVLEHMPDKVKMLNDIKRVLKPGGLCVAIVPSHTERLFSIPSLYAYLSKRLICYLFNKSFRGKAAHDIKAGSLIFKFSKNYSNFPLPPPHGCYATWKEEFFAHLPHSWEKLFKDCGFQVKDFFSLMYIPWNLCEALSSNFAVRLYERSGWLTRVARGCSPLRNFGYNLCFILKKA